MITIMRKHHKVLMIVITGLVCISFSWYWNRTDFAQMGNGVAGKIYDRNVSQVELQRNSRLLRLASELGLRDLIISLTSGAQSENEAFDNFSWNLMVLRHEAEELGIKPTTNEITEVVKTLPAFQGKNGFELARYTDFVDHALAPMGFSEAQVEELAGDQITLERVQRLLGAGVNVVESQMRADFEQAYSKMDVSVVRFQTADFAKDVQVNDGDVTKYYESHKAQLQTDEKRQIQFVDFGLTEEQKKLTGKARIEVLQKLADNANDFSEALQAKGADFNAVARKFQVTPKETGEFAQAAPPPELSGAPELAQSAFSLTNDAPNSEPIQTRDGFYIEHLAKIDPARPLTLAEARPKIETALKEERAQALMKAKAEATAEQIRSALKNNKPLEEAAAQAGVKAEPIAPFALLDNPPGAAQPAATPAPKDQPPDMQTIKQALSEMDPGSVSDFLRRPQGGLLVIMEKREPLNSAQFNASRPFMEKRMLQNKGQVVFYEWLRERRRDAGIEQTHRQQLANG